MGCTRRAFLAAFPGVCAAAGKGAISPAAVYRYSDPTTEFPITRLTDAGHTSRLPVHYTRCVAKKGSFLLYSSDFGGSMEVYRLDLKNGQSRQLTDSQQLDPTSVTLLADERGFCYVDNSRLFFASISSLRPRQVYMSPQEIAPGLAATEDGLFALVIEKSGSHYKLHLIRISDGSATTLAEADEPITDAVPRPKRASVLYRRGGGLWLANFDGQQNYRLRVADGEVVSANWSPDGRSVLYLNVPADAHKLRNIREFTPDTNEDKAVADTTQYACFERNGDASVFAGASASKASPHVLLLVRAVKREFTLCEHRASDPAMVAPVFSPNSQRVFFTSDQHGKPAIYSVAVDKLVAETESNEGK